MKKLKNILTGDSLKGEFITKDLGFKIYVFVLIIFYILYSTIAPSLQRRLQKQKEINEDLRQRVIYYSSQLMQISLESQIKEEVKKRELKIKPLEIPPYKIIVDKTEKEYGSQK